MPVACNRKGLPSLPMGWREGALASSWRRCASHRGPSRGKQLSQLRIPLFRFAKVAVRTYMYLVHARTLGLASSRAGGPRAVRSALNPKSGGGDCV